MRKARGAHVETLTDATTGMSGDVKLDKAKMEFLAVVSGEEVFHDTSGDAVRAWLRKQLRDAVPTEWVPVIEVECHAPRALDEDDKRRKAEDIARGEGLDRWGKKFDKRVREITALLPDEAWKDDQDDEWDDSEEIGRLSLDVELKFARYYVGKIPGGSWRLVKWDAFDAAKPGEMVSLSERWRKLDDTEALALPLHEQEWDTRKSWLAYSEELWAGLLGIASMLRRARQQLYDLTKAADGFDRVARLGAATMTLALPAGGEVVPSKRTRATTRS